MTIGQRIAEQRKRLGLSQEALGDKLGVSRQAISKWESDAALPEIDKLIALSKLFGVTVGWLLGVEELPQESQDPLTEEQLNAMEQLIKLYTAPSPEPKRSKLPLFLSSLALLLSGVTLLSCLTYHNNLSNSLGNLSYQMISVQSNYDTVRAQINDLETAQSAPGIPETLHSFDFQLIPGTVEPRVTVRLSAIPKQQNVGWTAEFSARKDGAEVSSAACIFDGTAYIAELELDMEDGYEYWLVLANKAEGIREQIPLQDTQAQNLKTTFSLTCSVNTDDVFVHYVDEDLCVSGLQFTLQRPVSMEDGKDYQWKAVAVVLYRNGEEVARSSFISEEDRLDLRRSVSYDFSGALSFYNPRVILENGDGIEVWLIAEVSNGMECKEMVGSWRYEDGSFYGGKLVQQETEH